MTPSRRQTGLILAAAALGLVAPSLAAARRNDEDDAPANVFISPCGQPFRAPAGAPYPVGAWFKQADTNADGRLDHGEFVADAGGFFDKLDLHKRGILGPYEIAVYEHRVAPEVLGARVHVEARGDGRGLKWLVQADRPGDIAPSGAVPNAPAPRKGLDESGVGASPYSFFDEPEPITAADLDLIGFISRANFLKLADIHFATLDRESLGYLTLATLPRTAVQAELEGSRRRRGRS
jgi:hypothetical protein